MLVVNVLRITALIIVGTSVSADVAEHGFHREAGWIGFTLVALGLIALFHRFRRIPQTGPPPESMPLSNAGRRHTDSAMAAALLAPLLIFVSTSMVTRAFSGEFDLLYPVTVIGAAAALWAFRNFYRPLLSGVSWASVAIGVAVFLLWTAVGGGGGKEPAATVARLGDLPLWFAASWICVRLAGSVLIAPVAEELAFRGYLLPKLIAKDFQTVRPGQFTWLSFLVSSALFGLLHQQWIAGGLAGAGYALALYRNGRISDAIAAHVTTNALIVLKAWAVWRWGLIG
jgi:exosortase E/protease (VPEID-CTERM system)